MGGIRLQIKLDLAAYFETVGGTREEKVSD